MKKYILIAIVILAVAGTAILTQKFLAKQKNENPEIENSITLDSTSSTKLAAKKKAKGATAISIKDFAFSPTNKRISKNTKVIWTNNDNASHTIMSYDKNGPKSQLLDKNAKYGFIFTKVGTFAYYCSVHPTMTGTITVQ